MEIYICSFAPTYCPTCGKTFTWKGSALQDFFAHASHSCNKCGTKFQYVEASVIENTALKAGGDM